MAGPHDWDWPTTATPASSPVNTVNPNFGGPGTGGANQPPQVTTPPVVQNQVSPAHPSGAYNQNLNPPTTVDITEDITEDIGGGHFGLSLHGDQPYEPPPVVPEITDLRIMETLADIHGQNPKYKKSWDFDEKNPDNLLKMVDEYGAPTHTLGSFIVVDSSNNPVLDSSGNVIYTSFGKHMNEQYQADPEGFYNEMVDNMTWEDMAATESDFWRGYTAPGGEGEYDDYERDILGERRAWQEGLFYGPKVAPQRNIEAQGFFNTLGSKIRNPFLEAVGETLAINPEGRSGLYGKMVHHAKLPTPWGLEREYATGRARGGIMGPWNNRR